MATGDKVVTLDGLKAVYDSQDTDGIKQDISDLKSALTDGYHVIDADWAVGKIDNGTFSPSDYKKVSTENPVELKKGDVLKIDSGYKLNIYLISNSTAVSVFYWGTSEYHVSLSGRYMLSITSDPEPSGNIQDKNEYLIHVKCTNSVDRQLLETINFLNNTIIPNIEYGKNLFNREMVTPSVLINKDTGVEAASASYSGSDFIRVYANETIYKRNCNNWYCCLYDLNYNYVEPLANSNDTTISQDGYIRVTVANANLTTAIVSRTYPLPSADDYKPSFIDRTARKEIDEMSTWSNTIENVCTSLEIRDANYHAAGSVDLSEYAFASIRVSNDLGVSCTLNFYDDRNDSSTGWMKRSDGSYMSVAVPVGASIITADDFAELPYLKYLRPLITPASAPSSGSITIQIVGRK